jgi:hypothetical protein
MMLKPMVAANATANLFNIPSPALLPLPGRPSNVLSGRNGPRSRLRNVSRANSPGGFNPGCATGFAGRNKGNVRNKVNDGKTTHRREIAKEAGPPLTNA